MLMLNQGLTARKVTFTQDNETGTRTTLELVNEAELHNIEADLTEAKPTMTPEELERQRQREREMDQTRGSD
jgi:hypothetical protein